MTGRILTPRRHITDYEYANLPIRTLMWLLGYPYDNGFGYDQEAEEKSRREAREAREVVAQKPVERPVAAPAPTPTRKVVPAPKTGVLDLLSIANNSYAAAINENLKDESK